MNAVTSRRSLAAEAARLVEETAEALAPAIQRRSVLDRNGVVLRGPRVEAREWRDPDDMDVRARSPRTVRGYVAVDVIQRLYLAGSVTAEHTAAAVRLVEDYETIIRGGLPGSQRLEGGRTSSPSFGPAAAQLDAVGRYRAAVQAAGPIACAVLLPVVLGNAAPADLAERIGVEEASVVGRLRDALTRLASYYESVETSQKGVDTARSPIALTP